MPWGFGITSIKRPYLQFCVIVSWESFFFYAQSYLIQIIFKQMYVINSFEPNRYYNFVSVGTEK